MAGIYLHIPYCKTLCPYCDFYHIIHKGNSSVYTGALLKEAELRKDYTGSETISTIYLGGGTPSVFTVQEISHIVDQLHKIYNIDTEAEITIEVNPDDIDDQYTADLRKTGINRVSMGVQSWRDEDLKFLNRRHNAKQADEALGSILKAGFENVTIDLIYGIPGMSAAAWAGNLDKSVSLGLKHLSAYHLTIEPGTVFGRMKEKGRLTEVDEEESIAQFNILIDKAEAAGFVHYEISNFGQPGYFSVHNTNYWKQVPYIGLGPSAHSFNGYSRQWNVRDVKTYIKNVTGGKVFFEREELNFKTKFNEYIMTSLRTMWGIDLDYVEKSFDKESYDYIINLSSRFISYGMMKQEKRSLILTNQGKMISDNIISEFMMP